MPASFPEFDFRTFGVAACAFFPALASQEAMFDAQEKRRQFDWSWQAVRYRYRSCTECNDEFKNLHTNAGELFKSGWGDEETMYMIERCIYVFFMSGLSVFDSFAYCLYFFGNALEPAIFPEVANPGRITRAVSAKAFQAAFPNASITGILAKLSKDPRFSTVNAIRNLA